MQTSYVPTNPETSNNVNFLNSIENNNFNCNNNNNNFSSNNYNDINELFNVKCSQLYTKISTNTINTGISTNNSQFPQNYAPVRNRDNDRSYFSNNNPNQFITIFNHDKTIAIIAAITMSESLAAVVLVGVEFVMILGQIVVIVTIIITICCEEGHLSQIICRI